MVIGLTLLFRNLGTTAWAAIVIVAGLFYGVVGVFALGVVLDVVLLTGALAFGIRIIADGDRRRRYLLAATRTRASTAHTP
jgi:hypothetical protein